MSLAPICSCSSAIFNAQPAHACLFGYLFGYGYCTPLTALPTVAPYGLPVPEHVPDPPRLRVERDVMPKAYVNEHLRKSILMTGK